MRNVQGIDFTALRQLHITFRGYQMDFILGFRGTVASSKILQ